MSRFRSMMLGAIAALAAIIAGRSRQTPGPAATTVFTPAYVAERMPPDSAGAVLTVEEYAAFYEAMPTWAQRRADPVTAARRVRAWERAKARGRVHLYKCSYWCPVYGTGVGTHLSSADYRC